MRDARREPLVPIDHHRIVDGVGQLDGCVSYVPFDTYCGICDESCHVAPRMQKYILEENGVPVKSLQRGAVFCERCRARRARIHALRRGDGWRRVPGGAEEVERLEREERDARAESRRRFEGAPWPYRDLR